MAISGQWNYTGKSSSSDSTINSFDKILELDPNNINALVNKGNILLNLSKYNEGLQCFAKVLVIDPNNITALDKIVLIREVMQLNTADKDDASKYKEEALRKQEKSQ